MSGLQITVSDVHTSSHMLVISTLIFFFQSRELLSYSLIHPAFDNSERQILTTWMSSLDGRTNENNAMNQSVHTNGMLDSYPYPYLNHLNMYHRL